MKLACVVVLSLGVGFGISAAYPGGKPSRVIVVAHRGGAGIAPENTLAAIRKAIRVGADYVELDVRTTADGELVLMHDRTVDRTTNASGEVAKLTYADIARLHAGKEFGQDTREPVPRFADAVRLCRSRIGLYIDHKDAPVADVIETLHRLRFGSKVIVYGSLDRLEEYRRLSPKLAILPGHPEDQDAMAALVARLSPDAMDGHLLQWTPDQVEAAHRHGAAVWMDVMGPTDGDEGWQKAIEMGADALQTDYPDRLAAFLRKRHLR